MMDPKSRDWSISRDAMPALAIVAINVCQALVNAPLVNEGHLANQQWHPQSAQNSVEVCSLRIIDGLFSDASNEDRVKMDHRLADRHIFAASPTVDQLCLLLSFLQAHASSRPNC